MSTNNEYNEQYIEINLKDLIFQVMYKWKKIIACAVIIAIIGGAAMAFSEYQLTQDNEAAEEYAEELQRYQDKLTLSQNKVSATKDKINTIQDYIDHAVLMKADYRNVYVAKASYYIDSDYRIMPESNYQNPDKTYTLTWYYTNFLQDYSVYQAMSEETGIDAKYLMDLVSVGVPNDDTLFISISHPSERYAKYLMDSFKEKLSVVHENLSATIEKHDLTLMLDTVGVSVNEELKERQQSVYDELLSYQERLLKEEEELKKLEDNVPHELNVPFAFVKGFVLGGFAGAFLIISAVIIWFVMRSKVHRAHDVVMRFSLAYFGSVVRDGQKFDFISKWLREHEQRLWQNSEESCQFLAANINYYCKEVNRVLLCSDLDESESQLVSDTLSSYLPDIKFEAVGSPTKEAKALRLLPQCDVVIMVMSSGKSSWKEIAKTISAIGNCDTKIAGFIMID